MIETNLPSRSTFGLLIICLAITGVVAVFFLNRPASQVATLETAEASAVSSKSAKLNAGLVKSGGVWRSPADIQPNEAIEDTESPVAVWENRVGKTKLIKKDTNENVKSIAAALNTDSHPERLSAFIAPAPFVKMEFLADPQAYLDIVEPGRAYQSADFEEGVQKIKREGGYFHRLIQGESVQLKAKVQPGMPVTFYSNQLGQFENQLTTITVRADELGIADARFFATPGTFGDLDIVAASPLNSDQARWLIRVKLPREAAPSVETNQNQGG